ncbi:CDP-2,3-bis-(O-geranylgeranyl)-sn-glycerol synthase [Candidatus Bathyarchaeota archaeon]|nr:CDP-2,3-bis-(O-geranylgeranyl)-sn-glycerol synthase [Candidatus Bathyarchaeota archaeon]TET62136.1 MAG: CDP-2,3-bis-(O-geranylgeranyl)-sn-glycerol synthase [Candidatus Bathyarchaeota archaeon]
MEPARLIIEALKFILPAYFANAVPVIAGGGFPVDFGKVFFDGKPIFGKNKTLQGFFSGLAVGTAVGFAESVVFNYPIAFGLLLSLGALFGDLTGAFVKRRLGFSPGDLLPVVDQVDFIIGAILFSLPLCSQILSWELIVTVLIVTPPAHLLTNFVAYKLGLKSNPW